MLGLKLSMTDKVAFVTGASSGLGAHFAKVLAKAGASVIVGARRVEKLDALVKEITAEGGAAFAVELDVTNAQSVSSALTNAQKAFGPINVLVNNAGTTAPSGFSNLTEPDWDRVMDTNLKGAWRVATHVAMNLKKRGLSGSIVNISSIMGIRPALGDSVYSVSKAGLIHLTKMMALEFVRSGIRVNALCPGYFKSEITEEFINTDIGKSLVRKTPMQRIGELNEINAPLLMLTCDAGSFITGAIIPVDGGQLLSSL